MLIIYTILPGIIAKNCFPGDFECAGGKMKICSKEGYWIITECPLDTKCARTEHAISCTVVSNILLELEPRVVKEKILPLVMEKEKSAEGFTIESGRPSKFEITVESDSITANPPSLQRKENFSFEDHRNMEKLKDERRLLKILKDSEKSNILNSLLWSNEDLKEFLASDASFSASGKSSYESSASSASSAAAASNYSNSQENTLANGGTSKSSSSGSSSSSSSSSFSSSSSGSSEYSVSGNTSQKIAADQQKANNAQQAANAS